MHDGENQPWLMRKLIKMDMRKMMTLADMPPLTKVWMMQQMKVGRKYRLKEKSQ